MTGDEHRKLPEGLETRIREILDAAKLAGAERAEVRRDLEEHVRAALDDGVSEADLASRFGDPAEVGPSLGSARRRLRRRRRWARAASAAGRWLHESGFALRRLGRDLRFSLTAAATLALGVGAVTLVFALVHGVLLEDLPYPDPDRLVAVEHSAPGWGFPRLPTTSPGLYAAYLESGALERISLHDRRDANVDVAGRPVRAAIAAVTPSFLPTLGVEPALGRGFTEAEGRPGAAPRAILTHGLWRDAFGSSPDLTDARVTVDGVEHEIVGVLPRGFVFPGGDPRLLVPFPVDLATAHTGDVSYTALGRLPEGRSAPSVQEALTAAIGPAVETRPGLAPEFVARGPLEVDLRGLKERQVGEVRTLLWVLLGSVAGLLLIAAANLANLVLVRGEHRRVEMAVRAALGGRSADLRASFLGESLLLGLGAGAVGLGVAWVGLRGLGRWGAVELPRLSEVGLAGGPALFGLGLALLLALLVGMAPRLPGADAVAGTVRAGSGSSRRSPFVRGSQGVLVAAQVALAVVLVVGSGLMLRTGLSLSRVDPGFEPDGLLAFDVALPEEGYPGEREALAFHGELARAVEALPGVDRVSLTTGIPIRTSTSGRAAIVQDWMGERSPPGAILQARWVEPGGLETLGVPVRRGRGFTPADGGPDARALIVSESLARRLWPDGDAVGRRLRPDGQPADAWHTVVGVVADTRDEGLEEPPGEVLWVPMTAEEARLGLEAHTLTYAVRGDIEPGALSSAVRELLRARDPTLPATPVVTGPDILRASMARVALTLLLLGVAAGLSLFLGVVGIFGVVAYATERRVRELGIRKALGARDAQIRTLVLGQAARLFLPGAAAGVGLGLLLDGTMEGLVHGVAPTDPVTYALAVPLVVGAAFLAAALPAWRASRLDPAATLKGE